MNRTVCASLDFEVNPMAIFFYGQDAQGCGLVTNTGEREIEREREREREREKER